ncbi:MAG: DUF839 domain-containing protein [Cytophagaceae bacterium]
MSIVTITNAQLVFHEVPYQSLPSQLIIPANTTVNVLFSEGDSIKNIEGKYAPAKGSHDMTVLLNAKKNQVTLAVSHECNDSSSLLGDGGGMSVLDIVLTKNGYSTESKRAIDFSTVGGTYNNCSGSLVQGKGTVLTAEEGYPESNSKLNRGGRGYQDTSDFNGMSRVNHTGWMVEVDPVSGKAVQKLYGMGRYSHEYALVMEDNKTVYLTDDYAPGVFFKFVADKEFDFTKGQLYAFKQEPHKFEGDWMALPMERDSLIDIRDIALQKGATIFLRMEWMTKVNGKIYITETGYDDLDLAGSNLHHGKPAHHLEHYTQNNHIHYYHGGILEFDPTTDNMRPFLLGGIAKEDTSKVFSNPDAITSVTIGKETYLIICEDVIGLTHHRVSPEAFAKNQYVCEVYLLHLNSIPENAMPTINALRRIAVLPKVSEGTGPLWWNNTLFLNVQHPDRMNPAPYNKSCTVAIRFK